MAKKKINAQDEYVRINKSLSRIAERLVMGDGFHSTDRIHKSKKQYDRKSKHKKEYGNDGDF